MMHCYSLCSLCGCVCLNPASNSLLTWSLINCLWKFHQIYNFGVVGDKDELIRFWDQKVRGQGHSEPNALLQRRHIASVLRCWTPSGLYTYYLHIFLSRLALQLLTVSSTVIKRGWRVVQLWRLSMEVLRCSFAPMRFTHWRLLPMATKAATAFCQIRLHFQCLTWRPLKVMCFYFYFPVGENNEVRGRL